MLEQEQTALFCRGAGRGGGEGVFSLGREKQRSNVVEHGTEGSNGQLSLQGSSLSRAEQREAVMALREEQDCYIPMGKPYPTQNRAIGIVWLLTARIPFPSEP